jgi:hypothetical protein
MLIYFGPAWASRDGVMGCFLSFVIWVSDAYRLNCHRIIETLVTNKVTRIICNVIKQVKSFHNVVYSLH